MRNDRTELFFQGVVMCVELMVRLISCIQIKHLNTYKKDEGVFNIVPSNSINEFTILNLKECGDNVLTMRLVI